ncbi:hypothetical protein AVDCRST_MAG82-3634, partial [uncultured Rubrobacteraceae bacterium]
ALPRSPRRSQLSPWSSGRLLGSRPPRCATGRDDPLRRCSLCSSSFLSLRAHRPYDTSVVLL